MAGTPISRGATPPARLQRLRPGRPEPIAGRPGSEPPPDGRGLAKSFTGRKGAPTSRSDVQHPRNLGWPTGREPHGPGVSVGVGVRPEGECTHYTFVRKVDREVS